jgi:hypothetical protein
MKIENMIYKMLKTNTGINMCDSGGANGRMWQRNASKSLADFKAEPIVILYFDGYMDVTFSVFHHLTKTLELDEFCEKFNRMKCENWDGEFFGTSAKQCAWLEKNGFEVDKYRREFNTYNYDSDFSQVLQGTFLRQGGYVDNYVLLQIHQGADVRGGYTDAKLFKCDSDYFLYESAHFGLNENESLDYNSGGDIAIYNHESGDSDYLGSVEIDALCEKYHGQTIIGDCAF